MISDILLSIGLYLPNRTCIAFSQTNRLYRELFTSNGFWKVKLIHDTRFKDKTYLSYNEYQRSKKYMNYKSYLHVISTVDCDKLLLSSIIEYSLYNHIHPWVQEQIILLANDNIIKRGDIVSFSNIDIDDGCKYIYSGSHLESLKVHRDGSMVISNEYSVISEFPIHYWSRILSHSYIPFNIYDQVFDIIHMNSYSYLHIKKDSSYYYVIIVMNSDKLKKIIIANSLLSFLDSCYYSYKDPYPQVTKIKTGRRRTIYAICD